MQAQRPWIRQSTTSAGPDAKLTVIGSTLYMYDTVALRSFNHGATWETIPSLPGKVGAMSEFTLGLSLAATTDASNLVRCYFSSGGGSWTQFDSLSNVGRPVSITAIGETWYMATMKAYIYVFGEKVDSVRVPTDAMVTHLAARGTDLVAVAGTTVYVSSNGGGNWTTIGDGVTGPLYVRGNDVFAASNTGVKKVDIEAKTITDVGRWELPTGVPFVRDVDSYQGTLYAYTSRPSYQAYRLDGDTVWKEIAYPLPGTSARSSSSIFVIDAGFMVARHDITEGFTDSAGVYAYDLNDFTSVDEVRSSQPQDVSVVITVDHLVVTTTDEGTGTVDVVDALGRVVVSTSAPSLREIRLPASAIPSGFVGVIVRHANGTVGRGFTVR